MKRIIARGLTGAVVGAIPGGIMILLTVPVQGEAELSLGAGGVVVGLAGMAAGVIVAVAAKAKG